MVRERPRVRVGLAGAGFVARIHAEAYRHVRGIDVELRWVTARRPERARAFAEEFGVERVADDVRRILDDPDVDLVDLCVPNAVHASIGVEAARRGEARHRREAPHGILRRPGDAPRRDAPARARLGRPADRRLPRGGRAPLLRRELGLRAADPEGAPPAGGGGRADPAARGRGEPLGHPRAREQAVGDGRRRLPARQGLPSARRHPLSQGGRGPAAPRPAGPARLGPGRGRPARRHRDVPRRRAPLPQHRRGRGRRGLGRHAPRASTMARSPRSPPPTSCSAGSGTSSRSTRRRP